MRERVADAVEEAYRDHAPRLWRALVLYTGDPEVASDAVAETFARALAERARIQAPERWIWRVGFRIAARELKRRAREGGEMLEAAYEMPEPTAGLVEALRALSPKQRAAVVLHYYADAPLEEIARTIGSTRSAVGVHLHRARARLRELLGDADA